ncbi:MAG: Gfo/Idh/MocA family oxidoreductase [Deinococcota bacterium]
MTSPFRVLLVGCGSISSNWLRPTLASNQLELVGLVDLSLDAAKARAAEFELDTNTLHIGNDLKTALNTTRPDIVFNCTIPVAHFEVTTAALRAGAHVLSEKPLADTMVEAHQMIALAKETCKTLAVMQNRRYNPSIRQVGKLLVDGLIGDITTINADFYIGAHFGGFRDSMAHVLIKDMAIHTFDAARYLTGTRAEAVYCFEWNPAGSWYERDASAQAIFEMTNGIVFNYRGSWSSEGQHTSWDSNWRIVGTKGSLTWDGATGLSIDVVSSTGEFFSGFTQPDVSVLEDSDPTRWHEFAIDAFVDALATGKTPETHAEDNIHSLAMVFAAIESAQRKARVLVDVETLT